MAIEYDFTAIRRAIGYYIGLHKDTAEWDSDEVTEVNDVIQEGLMMFYQPPPTPEGYVHNWSFLKPEYAFDTVADTRDYDLPSDYEQTEGPVYFDEDEQSRYAPIEWTSPSRMLEMMNGDDTTTYPRWFTVISDTATGAAVQTHTLRLHPIPDAAYGLVLRYTAAQSLLTAANPYPLGMRSNAYTVYLACMAAAEVKVHNQEGSWTRKFERRVMADISADLNRGGRVLGIMRDGANPMFYPSRAAAREHLLIPGSGLTYNGEAVE